MKQLKPILKSMLLCMMFISLTSSKGIEQVDPIQKEILYAFTAQEGNNAKVEGASFKEGFLAKWSQMKAYTLEVAEAMPADKYSFKPADSVRTFAQQLKHLAGTCHFVNNVFLKGEAPTPPDPEFENTGLSKDEIKQFIEVSFDLVKTTVEVMTPEQFNETAVLFFHPEKPEYPKSDYINFLVDHCTHHRAQAIVSLRMNGIVPPRYRYF